MMACGDCVSYFILENSVDLVGMVLVLLLLATAGAVAATFVEERVLSMGDDVVLGSASFFIFGAAFS